MLSPRFGRRAFLRGSRAATAGMVLGSGARVRAASGALAVNDVDTSPLFTSFTIGPFQTKNRFVMAPMSVGEFADGAPTDQVVEHYASRARGGVGLVITGGVIVDDPHGSAETDVGRMNASTVDAWKRVVAAVHAHDAGIFCQLWHQGPLTQPGIGPRKVTEKGRTVVKQASNRDLAAVIEAFARSARLAQQAGFDGVEIHGAHGYLLDEYLRTYGTRATATNDVTPESFVYLLVKDVRSVVGPRFPVGFRFSRWSNSPYSGGYLADPASMKETLSPLVQAGVDVFHASRGYGPFWPAEYQGSPLSLAGWCRRITGRPTITVGHVGLDPAQFFGNRAGGLGALVDQFNAGQFDLVAVGRALLKNPEWVQMLKRKEYAALIAAGRAEY